MKRLIYGMIMSVVLCGMSACSNEFNPLADGNYRLHREKDGHFMKTLKMSFGGDYITESEEPLIRADEQHTYKALNVYWTEDKEGAEEDIYAYGVFVDTDDITIDLLTGYKYRFIATVLVDDRDKVALLNDKYHYPFRKRQYGTDAEEDFKVDDLGDFHYAQQERDSLSKCNYLSRLKSGKAYVDLAGDRMDASEKPVISLMDYPRVKRYYGESDGFVLTENDSVVNIPMAYKSFGLKIEIVSLPFGKLTVADVTKDGMQDKDWQARLLFPKDLEFEALSESDGDENSGDETEENGSEGESSGDENSERDKTEDSGGEGGNPEVDESEGEAAKSAANEAGSYQGLFSMHSMTAEKATFSLKFTWDKGNGLASKSFTREVKVHPNMNRILKVSVSGTKNESKSGNIVLEIADQQMGEESQEITYSGK